ncbi:MAG: hypothetical protein QNJ98_20100, partial [Planctomycetota bacterium]|nr:hypothetical protein [Planctomycetota bacterium]
MSIRPTSWTHWLLGALLPLLLVVPARADEDEEQPDYPTTVPVRVAAEVDSSQTPATGRWDVTLIFTPEEKVTRPYSVYLRITYRGGTLLNFDHAPELPTTKWRKGKPVRYTIPVPVPIQLMKREGDTLGVMVGFFDAEADKMVDPLNEKVHAHFVHAATLTVPEMGSTDDPAVREQLLARAKALAGEGKKADAWAVLELGIRRAKEDEAKYVYRDALEAMGYFDPRPISVIEKNIVARRIENEKRRYMRLMAGRYFDRKKLWAALRILEAVGGKISEEAGQAVIGALAEAKRSQKDIQQIQLRILGSITDEDKQAARETMNKLGLTPKLLEKARGFFKDKAYGKARYILRELMVLKDRALAQPARALLDEVDAAWLADTPPDQQKLVDDAVNHPAFGRIGTVATH